MRKLAALLRFLRRAAWEVVSTVVPALAIVLFVNVFVARASVEGPSMQPNLYTGYRVLADRMAYRFHAPSRGDVVIVDPPEGGIPLIKRVIALPGEVVEVRAGHVSIDGRPLAEPWVQRYGGPSYAATEVPAGHIFIMGDNRMESRDSRAFGPLPLAAVHGRVWLIYWPPGHISLHL